MPTPALSLSRFMEIRKITDPTEHDYARYGKYLEHRAERKARAKCKSAPKVVYLQPVPVVGDHTELIRIGTDMAFVELVNFVTSLYGITPEDICTDTHRRTISEPRQVVMAFAHKKLQMSLSQVGFRLCRRDHATILHGVRCVKQLYETNVAFRSKITKLLGWYHMDESDYKKMIEWKRGKSWD